MNKIEQIDLSNFTEKDLMNLQIALFKQRKLNRENAKKDILKNNILRNVEGAPLDPQPPENASEPWVLKDKSGKWICNFYGGTESDHILYYGPIDVPDGLEPYLNYDKDRMWFWRRRKLTFKS